MGAPDENEQVRQCASASALRHARRRYGEAGGLVIIPAGKDSWSIVVEKELVRWLAGIVSSGR